jgi:hypothetical protein
MTVADTETETATLEPISHRLDASYRNLDRALGSVTMADNKALIALTFQGAIVAGLALIAGSLKSALQAQNSAWLTGGTICLLVLFFACFCMATLKLFQAISPRITPETHADHPSLLFFFGGIASMPHDVFAARMRALDPTTIHEGLIKVTHSTAMIAARKFGNLRIAYLFLGLQMLFYVGIVLTSVLPNH